MLIPWGVASCNLSRIYLRKGRQGAKSPAKFHRNKYLFQNKLSPTSLKSEKWWKLLSLNKQPDKLNNNTETEISFSKCIFKQLMQPTTDRSEVVTLKWILQLHRRSQPKLPAKRQSDIEILSTPQKTKMYIDLERRDKLAVSLLRQRIRST